MSVSKGRVLVIDDEAEMLSLLSDFLVSENYEVETFSLATEALAALSPQGKYGGDDLRNQVDVIITDLKMAHMDGMQFLKRVSLERPEIPVVLISAFGTIDTAIEAMRNGAHNYVVKPFKLNDISVVLQKAMERSKLVRDNKVLRQEVKKAWRLDEVIGKSEAMRSVFDLIGKVAHSAANVLINGESGTGKEMVARAIHKNGPRANGPFIPINCTAIPADLLESELFGHVKGAFTGAVVRKKGLFEEANWGTLFLDEIGDMSPSLQAKLLRVLQDRKIRPVGDNVLYDIDVRIIAATHKNLQAAIHEGLFREDLFYRLSVIPITIPPLRDRPEDIPQLVEHFVKKFSATSGAQQRGFTRRAMAKLMKMRWPGNVRELENVVERTMVISDHVLIDEADIPGFADMRPEEFFKSATSDLPSLIQLEERYMRLVLEKVAGRKEKAAQILGINRRTLYRKEREYGLITQGEPADESGLEEVEADIN